MIKIFPLPVFWNMVPPPVDPQQLRIISRIVARDFKEEILPPGKVTLQRRLGLLNLVTKMTDPGGLEPLHENTELVTEVRQHVLLETLNINAGYPTQSALGVQSMRLCSVPVTAKFIHLAIFSHRVLFLFKFLTHVWIKIIDNV